MAMAYSNTDEAKAIDTTMQSRIDTCIPLTDVTHSCHDLVTRGTYNQMAQAYL